jgi:DNA-directed RNA polymerase subunit RPC12/RpoP
MPQNVMDAPVEKLDRVYVCAECGMSFLFRSDVEYHAESAGHREMRQVPLE